MKTTINLLLACIVVVSAWHQNKSTGNENSSKVQKGMTKVTILYSAGEGKTFDWDYYLNKHTPLLKSLLGDSLQLVTIDRGISGRTPGSPATYVAMFHMYFKTPTAYPNSFGPHAQKIVADVANYTNIQPIVQISEVQQ